jgi:hypothetical protein
MNMSPKQPINIQTARAAKSKAPRAPKQENPEFDRLAEAILLHYESIRDLRSLYDSLHAELSPRNASERWLVDTMVSARWRKGRIWDFRRAIIRHEALNPPNSPRYLDRAKKAAALASMNTCEDGYDELYQSSLSTLLAMRRHPGGRKAS